MRVQRPPFRPDWRCTTFDDIACWKDFAEQKRQAVRNLTCLLEKQKSMVAATADVQQHILTLLLVVKQQVYPAVLELGLQTMGRTAAVQAFLPMFLEYALLLRHPLVQAIKQGPVELPAHKAPEVDRSMYSLHVLERSINATRLQNYELHDSYVQHCRLVEQLLALMTYNPSSDHSLSRRLNKIWVVPEHQLPFGTAAVLAWCKEVKRLSPLFLFTDPCSMTRADLGPVEPSCVCTIKHNLQRDWQLLLECAPAPVSVQSQCSSGSASDEDDACNNNDSSSGGYACTSPAPSCVSRPARQRSVSAVSAKPPTLTPTPQQPKVSVFTRAAGRARHAVGAVVSWCVSAVKKVAAAVLSWL